MTDKDTNIASGFGPLLKFWRGVHGLSQETLALCAESSTRHISCLENGKSHPSRSMILKLAEVMKLGDRDSCYLLLAAGYLPTANTVDFHAPEYKWLRKAMMLTLKAMDPYPAALMDRYGGLLMVNKAWVAFNQQALGPERLANMANHFELLFSHQPSSEANDLRKNTLSLILMAMQQEVLLSGDAYFEKILTNLIKHKDVPKDWKQRAANLEPQASFRVQFEIEGTLHHFFNVSQMVGALGPTSFISEPRLSINTLYPVDPELDLSKYLDKEFSHPLLPY